MKKLIPVASLVIMAILAGCTSKPPANVTKATVTEAKPTAAQQAHAPAAESTPAAPAAPAVTYIIEPNDNSSLTWVGYGGVLGSMEGGFSNFTGTVSVPGGDLTKAQINVEVDMMSVFSDAKLLTDKLKGDEFFEASKYPKCTFTSTGITKTDAGYNVSGNLELHGAAKNIEFPATIKIDGDTLTAKSEFTFNRHAWGITYNGVGDNAVKDDVLLRFEITAPKKS